MQLGTRWAFGTTPPRSVPEALVLRIAAAEADHGDATGRHWTLTWLEGRPIAELDDGTTVRLDAPADGGSTVEDADDEW